MSAVVGGWLLALVLGAAHAFEPDHLAAMATLMSVGPTQARPMRLGALWGAGHAAMLLLVGGALVVWRLTLRPEWVALFEGGVALLLVGLGVRSLVTASRPHARGHVHVGGLTLRQPLVVGLAHGLAGTGALVALAQASMPSAGSALVYLVLFAGGTVSAMSLATGLVGRPFATRTARTRRVLGAIAGVLSVAIGVRMLASL